MTRYWTYITKYLGIDKENEEKWAVGTWHYSTDELTEEFSAFTRFEPSGIALVAMGVYIGTTSGKLSEKEDIKSLEHLINSAKNRKLNELKNEYKDNNARHYTLCHIWGLEECKIDHHTGKRHSATLETLPEVLMKILGHKE